MKAIVIRTSYDAQGATHDEPVKFEGETIEARPNEKNILEVAVDGKLSGMFASGSWEYVRFIR